MNSCTSGTETKVSLPYEKYTLANGLEVVLHEDFSDPIVSVAIQYHVGSNREKPGKTGFAHFFEHMLFQRSENLPRNAFFQKIDALGGTFNGGTSNDGTVYFETVPRDALEKILWMESDRMGYFINTVTEGGLKREIDVVANEKRQGENAPYGLANDLLMKNLFPEGHPYSWTVIGEIPDLRSATIDDVKEFYHTYYVPGNATLVVAGDFDRKETKKLIEKYFGEIPAQPVPAAPQVQNVTLDSTKRISHVDPFCNAPMLMMAYPAVEAYAKDGYALDFLCNILGGDKKSPLYKVLVEERKLVPAVEMFNYQMELTGMVLFSATTFPGVKLDDLYSGIEEAFARFEKEGVNPKDLERYKTMEEVRTYNRLTSTNGKAIAMAHDNVFTGDPDNSIHELKRYGAVTPEDVMRVYNTYIKGKHSVGISIVPKGGEQLVLSGSEEAVVNQESIHEQELNSQAGAIVDDPYTKTPSAFDRSVEPGYLPNTPTLNLPSIWSTRLENGMEVKGIHYDELPLITFSVELNSGMLLESPEKAGLARLTAAMLNEGTATKTPEELEEAIQQLGASIKVQSGTETFVVTVSCLKRNYAQVVQLVEEMLLQPRWDETAFSIVKERTLDKIRQDQTELAVIANGVFRKLVFGPESILANYPDGTLESVEKLTLSDVQTFYETHFSPSVAKMSFVGGKTSNEVERSLASLTHNWKAKSVPEVNITETQAKPEAKLYFVDYPDARQSYILVGSKGVGITHPDAYPADIVNDKLGGSAGGILFEILRLKHGYTYGAYSSFSQGIYNNTFVARSSVQATVTKESVSLFRDILSDYGAEYSQEYLDNSTTALLRTMNGSFETPNARLSILRDIALYGLPEDFLKQREKTLKNISLSDAKEQIERHLNFDDMTIVVVGDAKTQFAPLQTLGLGQVVLVDKNGKVVR